MKIVAERSLRAAVDEKDERIFLALLEERGLHDVAVYLRPEGAVVPVLLDRIHREAGEDASR